MILITGPTGSGKTTTLYSILEILNTPEINISTIETPQFINQYNTIGIAFDVMFTPDSGYGDFIHIADYANGLGLFRDTLAPPEEGSFSTFPGQIRSLLRDQNSSTQYIALSSIGGFYTYDLQSTPPPSMIRKSLFPSYAIQAVSNSNLTAYINLKYMGIGLLDYSSAVSGALFTNFYAVPFEISTFTKIAMDGYEHLILVDPNGTFHAINVK